MLAYEARTEGEDGEEGSGVTVEMHEFLLSPLTSKRK